LIYFIDIWYILWSFDIGIFPNIICLDQEKSGNPAYNAPTCSSTIYISYIFSHAIFYPRPHPSNNFFPFNFFQTI
jgi:hypothetical protein